MLSRFFRQSRTASVLGALLLGVSTIIAASGTVAASAAPATTRPTAPRPHFGGTHNGPASIADCPSNWACGFAKKDYDGGFGEWQGTNSNFNNFSSGGDCYYESDGSGTAGPFNNGSWNDCISSSVNNLTGTETIYWFPNSGCAGDNLAQANGATFQNLANRTQSDGNSWDDVISSDHVDSDGTC